jgi:hypothetical protein
MTGVIARELNFMSIFLDYWTYDHSPGAASVALDSPMPLRVVNMFSLELRLIDFN